MTATAKASKIEDFLLQHNVVTPQDMGRANQLQQRLNCSLIKALQHVPNLDATSVMEKVALFASLPFSRLDSTIIDSKIIDQIPEKVIRRHKVFPMFRVEDDLTLAICDPFNIVALDDLRNYVQANIQLVVTIEEDMNQAIEQFFGSTSQVELLAQKFTDSQSVETHVDEAEEWLSEAESYLTSENLTEDGEQMPIVTLVDKVVMEAARRGVSDIHFEPVRDNLVVRFRRDGYLKECFRFPIRSMPAITSRIKIISGMDIAERRAPQDGRCSILYRGREVEVRVSSLPTVDGEKMVMRILSPDDKVPSLEQLGMPVDCQDGLRRFVEDPNGIMLVTGPTGSGKSTTLYTLLIEMHTEALNVVTIEDPVERNFPGISQVQINEKAGMTFAAGLRSILRQDPDIIMIGEIRDLETAEIAVRSSLTGHLVLSTLHTNDAPSTLMRLIDMGIEPFLLAASIRAVLAQRLVRTVCGDCFQLGDPDDEERAILKIEPGDPIQLPRAVGCLTCDRIGYRGRTGLYEMLNSDRELERMIARNCNTQELRNYAVGKGMKTLADRAFQKVRDGVTTVQEIRKVISLTNANAND